jgi:hypothetical protein
MTVTQAESDQPALGPDGQLLDASKITWHHDLDDPHPIQSTSGVQEGGVFHVSHFSDNSFSCQVKCYIPCLILVLRAHLCFPYLASFLICTYRTALPLIPD